MDALVQTHSFFGIVEILCEAHDVPRGVTPKYTITCEGDTGLHEPHFFAPPRSFFFLNPGEYAVKCSFLGVVADDMTVMVNVGDTVRIKYHFHGRWSEGLPKPPKGMPRKIVQPVAPVYAPPPGYAQPAYGPPAGQPAHAPQPSGPPSAFPTPGQPPVPAQQPVAGATPQSPAPQQPRPAVPAGPAAGTTGHLGTGMHTVGSSIAPPPMLETSHMVAPPPPPPSRPAAPPPAAKPAGPSGSKPAGPGGSGPGTPGWSGGF